MRHPLVFSELARVPRNGPRVDSSPLGTFGPAKMAGCPTTAGTGFVGVAGRRTRLKISFVYG